MSNWSYFSKAFFLPNGSGITLYRQCKPLKLSFKELRKKTANSFLNEEMLKGGCPSFLPQALYIIYIKNKVKKKLQFHEVILNNICNHFYMVYFCQDQSGDNKA